MQETDQYFEKRFLVKQVLDFHSPFRIEPHIEFMKFCQNHWSLPYASYTSVNYLRFVGQVENGLADGGH
jgi:hypothetical protein